MTWIYFSPHLDDGALSCGGLIWEQNQAGEKASIWTICAGDPPAGALSPFAELLHQRWQVGREATYQRRLEDIRSCQSLGATWRHFSIPDCIYRQVDQIFLYASEEAIFGQLHPGESDLVENLRQEIDQRLPVGAEIVAPLALGGHVDHRLVRAALERLGRSLWYYPDYPYVLKMAAELDQLRLSGWSANCFPVSQPGLQAWQEAVAAHASQISTFWADEAEMRQAIQTYLVTTGGVVLWRKIMK